MDGLSTVIAWLRERPVWVLDGAVALLLAYAEYVTVGMLASTEVLGPIKASPGETTVLALAGTLPLALRRVTPLPVAVVTVTAALAGAWMLVPSTGIAPLIALYTVAAHRPRREAVVVASVALAGVLAMVVVISNAQFTVANIVVVATVVALGDQTRLARERAAALVMRAHELEHEREERSRLAVAGERARIARELHDITGHGVAVIAMQAAGARRVLRTDPDRADEALREIEDVARESLTEIRQAVMLLRDGAQAASPLPGLAQLEGLIARFRDAGLQVTAHLPDTAPPDTAPPAGSGAGPGVGPAVGLTVYRVVQEALTNALRHAGRTRAEVRVVLAEDDVRVTVVDDGPPPTGPPSRTSASPSMTAVPVPAGPPGSGGGHGLLGLRERVRSHGGQLTVRGGDAGYQLDARIPMVTPDVSEAWS